MIEKVMECVEILSVKMIKYTGSLITATKNQAVLYKSHCQSIWYKNPSINLNFSQKPLSKNDKGFHNKD